MMNQKCLEKIRSWQKQGKSRRMGLAAFCKKWKIPLSSARSVLSSGNLKKRIARKIVCNELNVICRTARKKKPVTVYIEKLSIGKKITYRSACRATRETRLERKNNRVSHNIEISQSSLDSLNYFSRFW